MELSTIRTYFKGPVIHNLEKVCRIITLMAILTSFFLLLKIMSHLTVATPLFLQLKSRSAVNSSSRDTFYPNIAVLVEFRAVDHIITVVRNVNDNIPSSWPIQIFHGKENEHFIRNSTLSPLIASGKVFLTLMEESYGRNRTNELLTTPAFWKRVRGEKILLFQIDSVMCSNSPHKITDFLQYDYIGAPWNTSWFSFDKKYLVGNGGFSLRTRSKILALLALVPYTRRMPEDVWYAQNMHRVNGSIPPVEIAKKFAVESVYYDRPLGVHRLGWVPEFSTELARTCPESVLIRPIVD